MSSDVSVGIETIILDTCTCKCTCLTSGNLVETCDLLIREFAHDDMVSTNVDLEGISLD